MPRVVPESRLETCATALRPVRRRDGDRRASAARLHDLQCTEGRLGHGSDDRAARCLRRAARRIPGHRDAGRGAADAAAHLPAEDSRPAQTRSASCSGRASSRTSSSERSTCSRCSATPRCGPASPGSQLGHLRRVRRCVTGARHPWLAQTRAWRRDGADRSRRPLDDPDAGARPLLEQPAGPFFITGLGTAFAFIPVSIAALAGVVEREAGLASGLLNTSQQLGGAIGVAIASTVIASRSHNSSCIMAAQQPRPLALASTRRC